MPGIRYSSEANFDLDTFIALYRASTLGERRPVEDRDAMADMLAHADLLVSAWDGERLVGLARTLTDWSYAAYLSDLAVDVAYQRRGIGVALVRETRRALGQRCTIILLAAPAAVDYYPKIGFTHHPAAWILRPGDPLPVVG
jgi:ribosomal protein S18 acetylase RimI-like enzyme